MYCKKCGKQLPDDAEFCSSCGTKVYHPTRLDEKKESNEAVLPQMEKKTAADLTPKEEVASNAETSSIAETVSFEDESVKGKTASNNKRGLIIVGGIVAFIVVAGIVFLMKTVFPNKNGTDDVINADSQKESVSKHHMVEDRSENPEGYDADIFEFCGYDSKIFGKSLNDVISSHGLYVVNTTRVGPEEKIFAIPIYAREGQSVVQAMDLKKSPSPTYYFILDQYNTVTGMVYFDTGGFHEISRYIGNINTTPRKVTISPGMANADYILCWRLTNGYKFVFSTDVGGKTCALGYADIVDPTQCYDYTNLIYGPIKEQYSDRKNMPDQLFQDMKGIYLNPDNNVFVEIDSADSIYRSVINGEYGKKDYFYLDRFDSYEKVGDNSYLIKVKCGDTKLSYLSQDVYNGDGTGRQTLYFNAVDEWTYSEDYIKNSKYCFYRDFTYEDVNQNNSGSVSNTTSESQSDNSTHSADNAGQASGNSSNNTNTEDVWNLDAANEGPLPDYIFEEIKGTYESEINGLQIVVLSPSQIIWESGSYRTTETIEACDPFGKELLIYTSIDGAPIILSVFHTDNGGMCMNTLEGGDWDYDKAHVHAALERISLNTTNNSVNNINSNSSGYIIPDSSDRLLTEADIAGLSKDELRKARNEIAARHGRRFKDAELQAYFESQSWYTGLYDPDEFDRTVKISDIEQKNMEFIKQFEK